LCSTRYKRSARRRQLHLAALGDRQQGRGRKEFERNRSVEGRAWPVRSNIIPRASRWISASSSRSKASVGAVYADLPSKTDGQYSGAARLVQERLPAILASRFSCFPRNPALAPATAWRSWATTPSRPAGAAGGDGTSGLDQRCSNPTENRRRVFFTQKAPSANGGMIDIEFKTDRRPERWICRAFSSKLTATNYNRNYLMWSTHFVNFRRRPEARTPATWSRTIRLTKANFTGVPRHLFTGSMTQIFTARRNRHGELSSTWTRLGMPAVP